MLEAAALVHYSEYPGAAGGTRSFLSIQRAFSVVDTGELGDNLSPSLRARWWKIDDGSMHGRYCFTFGGARNLSEMRQGRYDGASGSTGTFHNGWAWQACKIAAENMLTAIVALPSIADHITHRRSIELVFAGRSMGAAVADVLALRMRQAHPLFRPMVAKFNPTCVGSKDYHLPRFQNHPKRNWRTLMDPAHGFPENSIAGIQVGLRGLIPTGITFYTKDPTVESFDRLGTKRDGYGPAGNLSMAQLFEGFSYPEADGNQWTHHEMRAMRRAILQSLAGREDLNRYRFRYLEMPDEWTEQNNRETRVGGVFWNYNQDGEAPAAVTCPQRFIDEYLGLPDRRVYERDTQSSAGGGGDWDLQSPVIPVARPPLVATPPATLQPRRVARPGMR